MRRAARILLFLMLSAGLMSARAEQGPTRLFDKEYDFWDCDWSPDGQVLALAGKTHYEPADKARIWLYTAGATKPVKWTNTDALCDDWPRWSPDGKTMVLARMELAAGRRSSIWLKDTASGAGRRLTAGPDDRQPSWSPDGRQLVFRRGLGPQQSVLALLELSNGRISVLPIKPGLIGEPYWGRDGRIYYTRYELRKKETKAGGREYMVQVIAGGRIWCYQPSTGEEAAVLSEEFDQRMPALSPDGKWLAFYGQRGGADEPFAIPDPANWALFLRDQGTGRLTEAVKNIALTGGPPTWSRDGASVTFLLYSSRQQPASLWSCQVQASPQAVSTHG